MPPVKPPQNYIEVDAVLPETENFGPAERAAYGQGEHRHLREEGRPRRRLHSQAALDRCHRQLGRAVRLFPLCRGQLHPDLPHARPDRVGLGGHDRGQGHPQHRRRRVDRDRRRQGVDLAQAAGDRAGQLHRHSRTAAGGAVPVPHGRVAQRAAGGRGSQLHERQGTRHHPARARRCSATTSRYAARSATRSCGRRPSARTASPPSRSRGWRRGSSRTSTTTATGRAGRRRNRRGRSRA